MKEAVQDRRRGGVVAEEFSPILQQAIGGDQRTFSGGVAVENDVQQIVRGLLRHLLAQKQVIDDQEIGFGEELVDLFSAFELGGLEEVLEEGMGFTVDDLVAGFDGGVGDGFGDMAFAVMENFP